MKGLHKGHSSFGLKRPQPILFPCDALAFSTHPWPSGLICFVLNRNTRAINQARGDHPMLTNTIRQRKT